MQSRAFHVKCRLEDVDTTMSALRAFLDDAPDQEAAIRLEIVVTEALNNIVLHGAVPGDAGIGLQVRKTAAMVEVVITDPGPPVPAGLFRDAADPADIDPLAESGRGLPLIKAMSDGLDYRAMAGTNRLTLRFCARDPLP